MKILPKSPSSSSSTHNANNNMDTTTYQSEKPKYVRIAPYGVTQNAEPKKRRIRACDACRQMKIKCHFDELSAVCRKCVNGRRECTFNMEVKKRGPRQGYVSALENRLKRIESLLNDEFADDTSRPLDKEDTPMTEATSEEINNYPHRHDDSNHANRVNERAESSNTTLTKVDRTQQSSLDFTELQKEFGYEDRYFRENNLIHILFGGKNGEHRRKELFHRYGLDIQYNEKSNYYSMKKITPEKSGHVRQIDELKEVGILSPHETIKDINHWIYKVSGIDKTLSDRLLKIYFAYIHPLLPVINKTEFLEEYRGIRSTYPAAYLLNAIYGAAARYVETCKKFNDLDSLDDGGAWDFPEGFSEHLFQSIVTYIRGKYVPRISTIQSIIIAHNHSADVDNWTSGWLLNCAAVRTCQELGLHRTSNGWNISEQEKETRKMVWWSAYVVDRWFAAGSGRPLTIFDEDCDVEYPLVNVDLDEVMDTMTETDQHLPRFPSVTEAVTNTIDKIPLNEPFIQLLKLSEILGFVLQNLYTPKAKKHSAQYGSDSIVAYVNDALSKWRAALPPQFEISKAGEKTMQNKDHDPLVSVSGLLCLPYCTLLILLHRPFIEDSGETETSKQSSRKSLEICSSAAIRIIEVAETMHYRDFLLVSWGFALYPVFTASLIHIYNCSNPDPKVSAVAKANLIRSLSVMKKLMVLSPIATDMGLVLKKVITDSPIFVNDPELVARVVAGSEKCDGRYTVMNSETFKEQYRANELLSSHDKRQEEKQAGIHQLCAGDDNSASIQEQTETSGEFGAPQVTNFAAESSLARDTRSKPKVIATELTLQTPCNPSQQQVLYQPQQQRQQPIMIRSANSSQHEMYHQPTASTQSHLPNTIDLGNFSQNNYNALLSSAPIDQANYLGDTMSSLSYDFLAPSLSNSFAPQTNVPLFSWAADTNQQDFSAIFRPSPGNPFWSIPTSMEIDEWTTYLLPRQPQYL